MIFRWNSVNHDGLSSPIGKDQLVFARCDVRPVHYPKVSGPRLLGSRSGKSLQQTDHGILHNLAFLHKLTTKALHQCLR